MRTKIMGLDDESISFPSCRLMKSAAQSVYNSLKGGLDANTQQYRAICPKLKTSFECKFIIRMLLAIVTNSWRAMSLLQNGPDILESKLHYHQIRKLLSNKSETLSDFNFNLGKQLISSADELNFNQSFFKNGSLEDDIITDHSDMDNDDATESCELQERLDQAVWPKRYMVEKFTASSSTFPELRLKVSKAFPHNVIKLIDSVKSAFVWLLQLQGGSV